MRRKQACKAVSIGLAVTVALTGCGPLFKEQNTKGSEINISDSEEKTSHNADTVDNSEDSAKTVQEEEEWDGRPIKVESPIMKIESHNPYSSGKEIVEFGKYEQDGNEANGAEPIKWIVLDENDSELLLFSEYGIENQCFNDEYEADKIWEDSDIRAFLNEEFMGKAFSEEEKGMIKLSVLENSANPSSGKGSGSSTNDYVFCLSLDELEKYYPSEDTGEPWIYKNSSVSCEVTEYASRFASYDTVSYENYIGEYICEGVPDCIIGVRYADFWLRTSEALGHTGISVSRTGVFFYDEEDSYINTTVVVRPALRIDKKALSSLNRYSYPQYSSVLTEEDMEKLTKSGFDINDYSEGEKLYLKTLLNILSLMTEKLTAELTKNCTNIVQSAIPV